mmetsp:Transcript_5592/g.11703  ORF Transcript_5592/g.11703 Transcript_5592/m.11703 type:complete len:245 (+) Transcript_5592:771-1505(+)
MVVGERGDPTASLLHEAHGGGGGRNPEHCLDRRLDEARGDARLTPLRGASEMGPDPYGKVHRPCLPRPAVPHGAHDNAQCGRIDQRVGDVVRAGRRKVGEGSECPLAHQRRLRRAVRAEHCDECVDPALVADRFGALPLARGEVGKGEARVSAEGSGGCSMTLDSLYHQAHAIHAEHMAEARGIPTCNIGKAADAYLKQALVIAPPPHGICDDICALGIGHGELACQVAVGQVGERVADSTRDQ